MFFQISNMTFYSLLCNIQLKKFKNKIKIKIKKKKKKKKKK